MKMKDTFLRNVSFLPLPFSLMTTTLLEQQIDALVANHKVAVFSKTRCGFCHKAKRALQSCGVDLSTVTADVMVDELDQRPADEMTLIQHHLGTLTGATTVPRVFIAGKFVGGGNEVAQLAKSGELTKLLRNAGVIHA
jgi:glutaredoxin 3